MPRKTSTIRQLAREVGVETDDVLITAWDLGIDDVGRPSDRLTKQATKKVRQALGVPNRRELNSPVYWQEKMKLDTGEFKKLLEDLGISMTVRSSRLPKGAVSRLNAEVRRRTIASEPVGRGEVQAADSGIATIGPVVWKDIGHEKDLRMLNAIEVEEIHRELTRDFALSDDPITPAGVRDPHLLESAVARPSTSLGDRLKYPTVEMAAAALLHSVVNNHAFHNGNKRTALVAMLVFLDENGYLVTCDEDALFKTVIQAAQHNLVRQAANGGDLSDREVLKIAEWIYASCRQIEKGDHPIPWRRLRRILASFECETNVPSTVGNRMNVLRFVESRGRLGRVKRRKIQTQVVYTTDGRDAGPSTVAKIRADLELDEPNGIDSRAFYQRAPYTLGEFVVKYRSTLRRLARR